MVVMPDCSDTATDCLQSWITTWLRIHCIWLLKCQHIAVLPVTHPASSPSVWHIYMYTSLLPLSPTGKVCYGHLFAFPGTDSFCVLHNYPKRGSRCYSQQTKWRPWCLYQPPTLSHSAGGLSSSSTSLFLTIITHTWIFITITFAWNNLHNVTVSVT